MKTRPRFVLQILRNTCVAMAACAVSAHGATLPAGFTESLVASGLNAPTAMQFAADGRLFVCEQNGRLRVIKNGALLSTPFLTVTVSSSGERGLLGVAFDPDFAVNQFVYVHSTATSPAVHNRVSRFTASGDVAAPVRPRSSSSTREPLRHNHNAAPLAFGRIQAVCRTVARTRRIDAQLLVNRSGKAAADKAAASAAPRSNHLDRRQSPIWALGLRNRSGRVRPSGTSMFPRRLPGVAEEINDGIAGSNYGWPDTEGPTSDPRFVPPRYSYPHASGTCAIVGGAFYGPVTAQFPSDYLNDYFFADYCAGWIRKLDPANGNTVTPFATGISSPVDLKVADEAVSITWPAGAGQRRGLRIAYRSPTRPSHRSVERTSRQGHRHVHVGLGPGAPFSGSATAQLADDSQDTADSPSTNDSGERFRAVVECFGSTTSAEAVLTVNANSPPAATIHRAGRRSLTRGARHQLSGHPVRLTEEAPCRKGASRGA